MSRIGRKPVTIPSKVDSFPITILWFRTQSNPEIARLPNQFPGENARVSDRMVTSVHSGFLDN